MGRKAKYSDAVRARAIELRGRGMVTADIRAALAREFGAANAPNGTWINEATRSVSVAKVDIVTAESRAKELVAQVNHQDDGATGLSDDALRAQLQALMNLQVRLADSPTALSQLSGAIVRTVQAIDKRTPPPPPAKEIPPDWDMAAEECRAKMRAELQKMIDKQAKNE